ncbi:hypothetical protein BGX34_008955 [Mortierella sp. NVP85]|nr:hypothetical protein BGX34_008955 [Mortierella sp. NVP85]
MDTSEAQQEQGKPVDLEQSEKLEQVNHSIEPEHLVHEDQISTKKAEQAEQQEKPRQIQQPEVERTVQLKQSDLGENSQRQEPDERSGQPKWLVQVTELGQPGVSQQPDRLQSVGQLHKQEQPELQDQLQQSEQLKQPEQQPEQQEQQRPEDKQVQLN